MNKDFINPFLSSVMNVLSTMARIDARPAKPILKQDALARGDVTGFIGMTSEKAKGSLAITFPQAVIFAIGKNMLGETLTELDATETDLVGEFTNMVTGGAKRQLAEEGFDFDMATPAVISGMGHEISHKVDGPRLTMGFGSEHGRAVIEICFDR